MQQYQDLSATFTRISSADIDALNAKYVGLGYLNLDGYISGTTKEQFFSWLSRVEESATYTRRFYSTMYPESWRSFSSPTFAAVAGKSDVMWTNHLKERYSSRVVAGYDLVDGILNGSNYGHTYSKGYLPGTDLFGKLSSEKANSVSIANLWSDIITFYTRKQPVVNAYFMKTTGASISSFADNTAFEIANGVESLGRNKNRKGGTFANLKN